MLKIPTFSETVCLQQYRSNVDFLQTHIQLLDAALIQTIMTLRKHKGPEDDINVVLNLDIKKYNRLNHPNKQHQAIIRHSQKKNIEFAMVRLYNMFNGYLQSITREMYSKNPMLIVSKAVVNKDGEDKDNLNISYAEIIRLGSYEKIEEHIVRKIFRGIEDLRSTSKLLEKILKDTKVLVSKEITDDALQYLEMRHLFAHNHGKADHRYASTYGKKLDPVLKEGEELPTKFETFSKALIAVTTLITTIDAQLISNQLVQVRSYKTVMAAK